MHAALLLVAFSFLTVGHASPIGEESPDNNENRAPSKRGACVTIDMVKWRQEALAAHNKYREMHGAPPMSSNATLDEIAQAYATKLIEIDALIHSKSDGMGENLWYQWKSPRISSANGASAVNSWYEEINYYDFATGDQKPGFEKKNIGHLTQVLWDDSTQLGMGVAIDEECKKMYVVGNYVKTGNLYMKPQTLAQARVKHVKPLKSA